MSLEFQGYLDQFLAASVEHYYEGAFEDEQEQENCSACGWRTKGACNCSREEV